MSNDLTTAIANASEVVSSISLESDPSRPYLFLQAGNCSYDFAVGSSSKRLKLSSECGDFGTLCLGNDANAIGGFHPDYKDSSCFFGKSFSPLDHKHRYGARYLSALLCAQWRAWVLQE